MTARSLATRNRNRELFLLLVAIVLVAAVPLLVKLADSPDLPDGTWGFTALIAGLFLFLHLVMRRFAPNASPIFLPVTLLLVGFGYAMVVRLDPKQSSYQGMWILIGVATFVAILVLLPDYRVLDRFRYTAGLLGLLLLLMPLVPGIGRTINGSQLWVRIGPLTFQPGEIAKILLVVFFASFLNERRELLAIPTRRIGPMGIPDFKHFGPILAVWGLTLAVMMFEKDLGSSLLIFSIFLGILYVATSRSAYVLVGGILFSFGAVVAYSIFDHVQTRVGGWLDPLNPATVAKGTFQIAQSLFALAAGGLFGTGLGLGSPKRIPEVATDFVFSAIGEELGLVGAVAVIMLFVALVGTGLRTALRSPDPFGKLLASGFTTAIAVQSFIIIGGVTRLIPLTGITLPFISRGGSSVVSNFAIVSLLVAISDQSVGGPRGAGRIFRRKPVPVQSLVAEEAAA